MFLFEGRTNRFQIIPNFEALFVHLPAGEIFLFGGLATLNFFTSSDFPCTISARDSTINTDFSNLRNFHRFFFLTFFQFSSSVAFPSLLPNAAHNKSARKFLDSIFALISFTFPALPKTGSIHKTHTQISFLPLFNIIIIINHTHRGRLPLRYRLLSGLSASSFPDLKSLSTLFFTSFAADSLFFWLTFSSGNFGF